MAAGDLTTAANVGAYVNVGQADSGFVDRLVTGASDYFRSRTCRDIRGSVQTYTNEKHSGDGKCGIFTRETPVTAVTVVVVDGVTIPQVVLAGDNGWVLVDAGTGRIELVGYVFSAGVGNVSLTYQAGHSSIPADIEQAVIEIVAWKYRERDRLGQVSRSTQSESVQFTTAAESIGVKQVIDNYRRRDV